MKIGTIERSLHVHYDQTDTPYTLTEVTLLKLFTNEHNQHVWGLIHWLYENCKSNHSSCDISPAQNRTSNPRTFAQVTDRTNNPRSQVWVVLSKLPQPFSSRLNIDWSTVCKLTLVAPELVLPAPVGTEQLRRWQRFNDGNG